MRGGINTVRQTSPLTARMVSWYVRFWPHTTGLMKRSTTEISLHRVAMLIMGKPQFDAQDDFGNGNGIPPPPEWQLDLTIAIHEEDLPRIFGVCEMVAENIDPEVRHVFIRLRNLFHRAQKAPISSTLLHDLTCYVVHRLLLLHPGATTGNPFTQNHTTSTQSTISSRRASSSPSILFSQPSTEDHPLPISECIRYAMTIYMFITQGPTYYSHHVILNTLTGRFIEHLKHLDSDNSAPTTLPDTDEPQPQLSIRRTLRDPIDVWLVAIGLVAATGTQHYQWFIDWGRETILSLLLLERRNHFNWEEDILPRIKRILWLEKPKAEDVFKPHWEGILSSINI